MFRSRHTAVTLTPYPGHQKSSIRPGKGGGDDGRIVLHGPARDLVFDSAATMRRSFGSEMSRYLGSAACAPLDRTTRPLAEPRPRAPARAQGGAAVTARPSILAVSVGVRGRVRLHIDELRGRRALASRLQECLSADEGVRDVRTNPVTGSVLVLSTRAVSTRAGSSPPSAATRERSATGTMAITRSSRPGHTLAGADVTERLSTSPSAGCHGRGGAAAHEARGQPVADAAAEIVAGDPRGAPHVVTGAAPGRRQPSSRSRAAPWSTRWSFSPW